jgi:transcriptional regulator of nitric oxide reductase
MKLFSERKRSKDVCDQETDGEASVLRAETHRFRQEHRSGKSVISAHRGCGVAYRGCGVAHRVWRSPQGVIKGYKLITLADYVILIGILPTLCQFCY